MAGTKNYLFDPRELYSLLVHYTDGACPLEGEVKEFVVHPYLHRKIGLLVESDEWTKGQPLFLGYDGKRTMSWHKDGSEVSWSEKAETPNRQ